MLKKMKELNSQVPEEKQLTESQLENLPKIAIEEVGTHFYFSDGQQFLAISLEIRSLAALYPPPILIFQTDTKERGANAVGMLISPPATSEIALFYKALFCMWGGGE